jgi:tight adherence protein B
VSGEVVGIAPAAAFLGGGAAVWGFAELLLASLPAVRVRGPRALGEIAALAEVVVRVGREGRDPAAAERRRLLVAGGAVALCLGTLLAGPLVGALLGTGGPWATAQLLRARREHYRRAVDGGAAELAVALADALSAGHSLRGAMEEAARGLGGQAGHELRRVAAELAAGAGTRGALEQLRTRTGSVRIGTVVAACLVQGGAGGDLARLLRECAAAFGDQARLEDEARAATAQARYTGLVVALMPLGGGLLVELASPGFLSHLLGSWLTAWLVGLALAMQLGAAVAIRRLGRVRW